MRTELLQILYAGLAGCAFGVIFKIRPKILPVIFIGGALSWAVYISAGRLHTGRTMMMVIASMAVTLFSEIAARVVRMPVSVIYTPSIIPLIPGANLYYCIRGFVTGSNENFMAYGGLLLKETLGIVLGSIIVLSFVSAVTAGKRHRSGGKSYRQL